MKVYGLFIKAVDVVDGSAASVNLSDNSPATIPKFAIGNNGGTIYISDGNVGIGTSTPKAPFTVNGTILATEVNVQTNVNEYPDYVFTPDYKLMHLNDLESFIIKNGHLPDVPTAKHAVNNGMNLSEMNVLLLQKIEELTLYTIEQQHAIDTLVKVNQHQNTVIEQQTKRIEKLEKHCTQNE